MNKAQQVVKESIQALLQTNDRAVVRGVLRIYERQTAAEQSSEATHDANGVGFNSTDAEILTSFAKGILKYGSLTPKQMVIARKKMPKYWAQLAEIAAQNGREIRPIEPAEPKQPTTPDDFTESDEQQMNAMVWQGELAEAKLAAEYKNRRDDMGA
jgi:hypothetical protein